MEKVRNIKLFKNYYKEFYVAQTYEVRDKKTPPKEIRRAEAIKKEYFKEKENKK